MAESKKGIDTNRQKAIIDMASSLAKVFKKYSRSNREKAWDDLTKPDGQKEIKKILQNPDRSLNGFPKLAFKEWLCSESQSYLGAIMTEPTPKQVAERLIAKHGKEKAVELANLNALNNSMGKNPASQLPRP